MEYRTLPKGNEKISIIGLGLGNIHLASQQTIKKTISYALDQGIHFFYFVWWNG